MYNTTTATTIIGVHVYICTSVKQLAISAAKKPGAPPCITCLIDPILATGPPCFQKNGPYGLSQSLLTLQSCLKIDLWILVIVMLLGPDPLAYELVPDSVSNRLVKVPLRGDVTVLDESVVQVPIEGGLDGCHVL